MASATTTGRTPSACSGRSAQGSLEVGVNHVDQLVGGVGARSTRDSPEHVLAYVILEDLGEQAVDGAARGGEQMHDVGTVRGALEGALDGLDLAADAAD